MVPVYTEWWCTEANEATQTHCYNPVPPAYPVWAYYAHGRQRRCQEDPVSFPSSRLEKTTRLSPHHVAQHHPTGSETAPPYTPRSSRFGSEPPSVEDDVDVWRYTILELHARNNDDAIASAKPVLFRKPYILLLCAFPYGNNIHKVQNLWSMNQSTWLHHNQQWFTEVNSKQHSYVWHVVTLPWLLQMLSLLALSDPELQSAPWQA